MTGTTKQIHKTNLRCAEMRYPLSLRHLAETSLERGFAFSHETARARDATRVSGYPAPLQT